MALKVLPAKPDAPIINSGDLLEFLKSRGVNVDDDTVIANADGTVHVDTKATTSLDTAWDEYMPPEKAPPPPTLRENLIAAVTATKDVDELKTFLADVLIPALVPDVG